MDEEVFRPKARPAPLKARDGSAHVQLTPLMAQAVAADEIHHQKHQQRTTYHHDHRDLQAQN